jgi:ankyrin repeat protein
VCQGTVIREMEELNFSQSLDRFKESFLWAAAQGGNTEDCESLLGIGADINWKHQDGDTALLAACRRGHTNTVESLVVHGADINMTGADSLSPLHICCLRGDYSTLNILLSANPNLSLKTKDGKTALQLAEAKGHESICSRLHSLISSSGYSNSRTSSASRSTRANGK